MEKTIQKATVVVAADVVLVAAAVVLVVAAVVASAVVVVVNILTLEEPVYSLNELNLNRYCSRIKSELSTNRYSKSTNSRNNQQKLK